MLKRVEGLDGCLPVDASIFDDALGIWLGCEKC